MNDALLAVKVNAKLAMDPLVSSVDISVSCHDGAVTLTGNVDNYAQRIHVETLVASSSDVEVVNNSLTVGEEEPVTAPGMTSPNALSEEEQTDLETDLHKTLRQQFGSVAEQLKIEVHPGGVVLITGEVASELFKRSVEDALWPTAKVTWVVNRLVVGSDSTGDVGDDPDRLSSAIAGTKLNAHLIGQGLIREALGVKAVVQDDQVHLQGDVDNWYLKQRISEIAVETFTETVHDALTVTFDRDVEGELHAIPEGRIPVQPVFHHTVPPYQHFWHLSNEALGEVNKDIRQRLAEKYGAKKAEQIQVRVDSLGTAFVIGRAENVEEVREIEDLIWDVRGVRHIVNGVRGGTEK